MSDIVQTILEQTSGQQAPAPLESQGGTRAPNGPDAIFVLPFIAANLSFLLLLVQLWNRVNRGGQDPISRQRDPYYAGEVPQVKGIKLQGRTTVVFLGAIRLAACIYLLSSAIHAALFATSDAFLQYALCAAYVYSACLSLGFLIESRWSRLANAHVNFVLLVIWSVFIYRDVWPLATYTLHPVDPMRGILLWVDIGVLTVAAAAVPLLSPREFVPYDPKDLSAEPSPEQVASLLSRAFVGFLDPLVWSAARAHVSLDELPSLCDTDAMRNLAKRCLLHIDPIQAKSVRHIFWTLVRIYLVELIELIFWLFVMDAAYLVSPYALGKLLEYLESGSRAGMVRPWLWISLIFFGPLTISLTSVRYMSVVLRLVAQLQAVVTQVIFDHALRMRVKPAFEDKKDGSNVAPTPAESAHEQPDAGADSEDATVADVRDPETVQESAPPAEPTTSGSNMLGKINNLVTTDTNSLELANGLLLFAFMTPFQLIMAIAFLYHLLGWSVFVGLATMIVMMTVPANIARFYQGVQQDKMKKSDARVQIIADVMGGAIRMVKLFGWEDRMSHEIDDKRRAELSAIWKLKMFNLTNRIISNIIPISTMIVTFVIYTLVMNQELTASKIFPSVSVFSIIQDHLSGCVYHLNELIKAKVSLDRINDFLHSTELIDGISSDDDTPLRAEVRPEDERDVVGVKGMTFAWDASTASGTSTPGNPKRNFKLHINDEVIFKRGGINLVVGPTGSGKTSLLMAMLGEMHHTRLSPDSFLALPRARGIAYHAQESWILNDTIRSNILFGSTYSEERYKKVLHQCALERDLSLFSAGDMTEVGERGITLSGGQKARITLARAVYSRAQTLLLDDVLAALDVHTAQWVVDKCFKGTLVKDRTVILVTHNIALVSAIADFVIALKNGTVASQGSLSSVLAQDKDLLAEIPEPQADVDEKKVTEEEAQKKGDDESGNGKLILKEEISEGHVGWSALKLLFGNTGSGFTLVAFWVLFIGTALLSKMATLMQSWVLGMWAQQYELHDSQDVSVPYWLLRYTTWVGWALLMMTIGSVVFVLGTLRASRIIHKELVDSILHSTLRWLDVTPSSRIIARCSQDIDAVDNSIVDYVHSLTEMIAIALVRFGAVIIMSPVFGLPGALLVAIGVWTGQLYMRAQLAVKRERSNARAPILGHTSAVIAGLVSIRAYHAQDAFRQESFRRIDRHTRATITYNNLNRWISVRAEALAALFSAALAAYLVYGKAYDAARTGFSMTAAVTFSHNILWIVRYFNEFEVEGNSLERIQQYLAIDHEPRPVPTGVPPASWPTSGELVVEKLSARYSADGPAVLRDISFKVASGERIGIVGRTGSGKTSLTLALLRCIPTDGRVYYSGLVTDSLNLDALRTNITIIPQVPELLMGTLRENIDPFSEWADATLNDALASAGLFSVQSDKDEDRLSLDTQIGSGGGNLSVGQRQIIALARAIVRQSKVLILDEATSAIDYETDTVIQQSLRTRVAKGVTLLTVAHRLQTIMDYDKIMVLDAGNLVEFGPPSELLKNKAGYFRSLVDASGDREKLYETVKQHDTGT